MKKIEEKMCAAVAAGRWYKNSNTEVMALSSGAVFVKLYDTIIYAKIDGVEYFSDGGYNTVTTGSRLRALGADYSTNEKKNKCVLTPASKMNNMYFCHLFGIA